MATATSPAESAASDTTSGPVMYADLGPTERAANPVSKNLKMNSGQCCKGGISTIKIIIIMIIAVIYDYHYVFTTCN